MRATPMQSSPSPTVLAAALPGVWKVRASNLVHWLSGDRVNPTVTFEVVSPEPLTLVVVEAFRTAERRNRAIRRTAKWSSGGFVSHGTGLRRFAPSRWSVAGFSADDTVMVVVHDFRQASGDGIEVLVRDGAEADGVRASIAQEWDGFGLRPEDYAKLSWFPV